MASVQPLRPLTVAASTFNEIIVDSLTAGSAITYRQSAENFGVFCDRAVVAELNSLVPGSRATQYVAPRGSRAMYLLLSTSSLISVAPSPVGSLAATLTPSSPQSYVYSAVSGGDVWIVSQTTEGLRHGAYEFLRAQGIYYLGPDPVWKVKRFNSPVQAPTVHAVRAPLLGVFEYSGNGGFLNSPAIPGISTAIDYWYDFFAQCRNPREFNGGFGDGDEGFTFYRQHELRQDHNKLAWVPGPNARGYDLDHSLTFPSMCYPITQPVLAKVQPTDHGAPGLAWPTAPVGPTPWTPYTSVSGPTCTVGTDDSAAEDPNPDVSSDLHPAEFSSFGGLVKMHCEFHRDVLCSRINANGILDPQSKWVSVEGNDGRSDCRCDKCVNLLRTGPYSAYLTPIQQTQDSNVSDSVFHLVNQNARYLDTFFTNSTFKPGVGLEAYAEHGTPPSIPIKPNVLVAWLPSASGSGNTLTNNERAVAWANKRNANPFGPFTLMVEPSWLLGDTNFDAPKAHPLDLASQMKFWQGLGYVGLDAQTSYSIASVGHAFWIMSELSWNASADLSALLNQWCSLAFGTVSIPVRAWLNSIWPEQLYGDWVTHFEWSYPYVSAGFAALSAITSTLTGSPDPDPSVAARVDHLIIWVQWWRVYCEYLAAQRAWRAAPGSGTRTTYINALNAALQWCYSNVNSNVFHAARIAQKIDLQAVADGITEVSTAWDVTNYPAASGWVTVSAPTHSSLATVLSNGVTAYPAISGLSRVTFGDQLVPVTSSTDATVISGIGIQGEEHHYIFVKPSGSFAFTVSQQGNWTAFQPAGLPLPIVLLDTSGTEIMRWSSQALDISHGLVDSIFTIPGTVAAGTYRLEVRENSSCAEISNIKWARKNPIAMIEPPSEQRGFYTATKLYFYVPVGSTKVAMVFDSNDQPIQFYDDTGTSVSTTALAPNMWYATVASGHDGKVWSWTGYYSRTTDNEPHLLNCPNVYSFDPLQVMVPHGLDGF